MRKKDGQRAVQDIKSALKKAELSVPQAPCRWEGEALKVGFLLFPTCSDVVENGTLEDLCLSILSDAQAPTMLEEIDSFLSLLKNKHSMAFTWEFKTKLHTYFSIKNDYVSLKIGEAAKVGAFNWEDSRLNPMRDFLAEVL